MTEHHNGRLADGGLAQEAIISLLLACPETEQPDCILHEKRTWSMKAQQAWVHSLSPSEREVILRFHERCVSKQHIGKILHPEPH